ncbi:MAG: SDR family oxidoreductase [Actinobacteria bacterium]|nr:SDR family oxidoreductase [Actinomycetota bacterium]
MRVVVTGAHGFLGWHTRVRARALTDHVVVPVAQVDWAELPRLLADADAIVHIAGVNRGPDEEVEAGNVRLAQDLVAALQSVGGAPVVVYSNSIQAGNDTPYGRGKERARQVLADYAGSVEAPFVDVVLPNVFGEHGRPDYNSFVATFAHRIADGVQAEVVDREVELLHVQAAADALLAGLDAITDGVVRPAGESTTVVTVKEAFERFYGVYRAGDIPVLASQFEVNLFNTLRAAMFPQTYPIPLLRRTDPRGSLVETVRCHGGQGQTFFSTTRPGITRGQHFHLRKVERFVVVAGTAQIKLRKVLTKETVTFKVSGDAPAIVDMPTVWAHNITNTGDTELLTMFWTNELFNPEDPDTHPEDV